MGAAYGIVGVDMACLQVVAECTGCVTQTTGRVAL